MAAELEPLEFVRTEWLMTISLADQLRYPVPVPYALQVFYNSLGWTTLTPLLVARTSSRCG